jgi:hypothetical protein
MLLESAYDKIDDVPEPFRPLYAERGGKFELTGVKGVKPETAFTAVQEALRKERADHTTAKNQLKPYSELGLTFEQLQEKLDLIPQLEAAAEGKVREMTEAQKNALIQPLQRNLDKLTKDFGTLSEENKVLKEEKRVRTIHDAVRGVFTESKGLGSAMDDALMYAERMFEVTEDGKVVTKDGVGVVPGLDAKLWLQDMQQKKPHWWPPSNGGGAGGSGGGGSFSKNPWSKEHWNMTAQGAYAREHGQEKAAAAAKAVGSSIGAIAPPK